MQNQAHEGVHLMQKAILAKTQKREKKSNEGLLGCVSYIKAYFYVLD
jgi:hypothetical protein